MPVPCLFKDGYFENIVAKKKIRKAIIFNVKQWNKKNYQVLPLNLRWVLNMVTPAMILTQEKSGKETATLTSQMELSK